MATDDVRRELSGDAYTLLLLESTSGDWDVVRLTIHFPTLLAAEQN